jgi:inorganic pyrophosphatase
VTWLAVAAAVVQLSGGCAGGQAAQLPDPPDLPAAIAAKLDRDLAAARRFARHVWRDTASFNADGTVNGFVEIARGESEKRELRIPLNRLEIDRVIPSALGGYPVAYGFVPQTIAWDGDPFDVLLLGQGPPHGTLVRGRAVGLMGMVDEKGLDSKVVLSPLDAAGRSLHALDGAERARIGRFFDAYKKHEAHRGKFSRVTGWGGPDLGLRYVRKTAGFFAGGIERARDIDSWLTVNS